MADPSPEVRPLRPIRRFDIFAETKRLEAIAHGEPEDVAKGYGIRIAKIVASRRFGGAKSGEEKKKRKERQASAESTDGEDRYRGADGGKFRAISGELQTDETFDHEIIDRMGPEFYDVVFAPSVRDALDSGKKYEQIRDTLRKDWKPARQ